MRIGFILALTVVLIWIDLEIESIWSSDLIFQIDFNKDLLNKHKTILNHYIDLRVFNLIHWSDLESQSDSKVQ